MSLGSRLTLVVTCLTLIPGPCRAQNDCFTSSSIVGAVLGTFFSTAIALALLIFLLWWIYYRRTPNGADRQNKGARAVESGSGFDNPCFEANPNSDVVDGGKTEEFGQKDVRSTSWTPLRFFGANKNEKKRSMDDSFISEPERVSVQLRGHDFTGLGFNVTGNMRDGIFIKDILNRGPAFESGKIAPGDRILNVTISFRHVVYEDALTILSYASPYDVTMELEKGIRNNSSTLKKRKTASTVSLASTSPSATLSTVAGSVQPEGPPNERLVHPLYRSQSIDDLSKVGRADMTVRADMRIPSLAGRVGGGLAKSKLLGKANLDFDAPTVPDIKIKGGTIKPPSANIALDAADISFASPDISLAVDTKPPKVSKFGIKVLPDLKFKAGPKSTEMDMPQHPTGFDVPEIKLNLPKVEIHTPKASDLAINIDVPDGSGIKLPTRNVAIDMPEQEYPIAVSMGGDVKLNIEAPSLNFSAPVRETEINLKGPKINQPNIDVNLPSAPNVNLDFQSPSLPDVAVGQELPNADISLDLSKTPKSGFHIKFPKFGGSKTVKGDIPEVGVQLAAPELDVSLPAANIDIDPKLKKDGTKAGFEFKMPKMSMKKKPEIAIEAYTLPTIKADVPEVDVDLKIPGASIEMQSPSLSGSAPDVDVPSVSVDVKKPKIDFSMPKFSMGKDQGELKNTIGVNLDMAGVQMEKPSSSDSDSDDDTDGGKAKLKFGKMPKLGFNKPQGDIDVSAPEVSADIELPSGDIDVGEFGKIKGNKKNKFGMKMPKFGASATVPDGHLDLDASLGVDVKLPSGELKEETSDSSDDDEDENGDKKKKGFNIKMPKFGLPKAELSAPKIDVQADLPSMKPLEGNIEVGVPNFSGDVLRMQSDTEDTDNEDEIKKKSKSLKIKAPELQFAGGIGTPSLALSPIAIADINTTGAVNLDVKAPSLDFSTPGGSSEFKMKGPKLDQPNIDVTVPSGSNLDLDFKVPSLPDVPANLGIPHAEASVEASKGGKSGFHIKFPKFGGGKTVKVDSPETGVKITGPEIDLALRGASIEVDPKLKKDGSKAGFEFKMPKLSLKKKPEIAVEDKAFPTLSAQIPEVDIDVKVHGSSIDIQPPSLSASGPDVDLPSVSLDVKKPKTGFSMPKFNMGKGHGDLKGSGNVALTMPSIKTDVRESTASSDSEDDSDGGKKKSKFGKMPKFELNKPQIQLETSTPDISGDVDMPSANIDVDNVKINKKSNFGMKMPTFGASGTLPDGSLALDASHGVDVKLPSAEIKGETSDSSDDDEDENGDKKKKRFNIKMPKFGLPKGDITVNTPKIDMQTGSSEFPNIKPLEGNLEIEAPKISTSFSKGSFQSDDSDSEDETKKRSKGAFGFGVNTGAPDFDAKLAVDTRNLDVSTGEAKKGSKLGIKLPKMKMDRPRLKKNENSQSDSDTSSDDEKDEGKALKASIAIPLIDLSGPDAKLQGNLGLPNAQFRVEQPKIDLEAEIDHDDHDDDEDKKKSSKFGFSIKMPKFHMKKKSDDRDLSAQLNLDSASGGTDDDRSGEDKKKGKESIKLPKFGLKKPDLDVDLNIDKSVDIGADVNIPKADLPELEAYVKSDDKKKMTFSLPEVTIEKPKFELGLDSKVGAEGSTKFGIDMGKGDQNRFPVGITMSGQVQPPSVPDVGLKAATGMNPQVDVDFKGLDLELDHDELDDEKKKSKFFKMPKFHMGKHHGEIKVEHGAKINLPDAELNLPTGKLEVDSNVSLDASSRDDADSDDDKKESKKKTRFGIKMPKFQMKHSHGPGVNLDVKAEGVKVPSLEANIDGLVVEHDSISSDNTSIEMDLPRVPELNPIDVDLTLPHAKLEIPEKDGKKKGKFSFKSNFKMPKLHMSGGKGHADLEVPSTEINLPKVDIDPIGKVEIDFDDGAKKKSGAKLGGAFNVPKMDKHSASIDIKTDIPTLGLGFKGDAKHDDSDDDKKKAEKSKSGGFAFKMPKLSGSSKADIDLPEIESQLNVKAPTVEVSKLEASFDLDEGDLVKKSPFIVKMPAFNPVKPDIQLDVSKPEVHSDSYDSDSDDEKSKKGFKLGFKMPHFSMGGKSNADVDTDLNVKLEHPDPELPAVGAEVSLPKTDMSVKKKGNFEGNFKMPSFGLKTESGTEKAHESDDSESDDEKSKKGFKLGFKMPDFSMGGKGDVSLDADVKTKQLEHSLPTLEADVSLPDADLTTKKKSNFGANFKMPSFTNTANLDTSGTKQVTSDDSSDSEDENSKKGLKLGFKMPKLSMGGKNEANLDSDATFKVKLPEHELPTLEAAASLPEADLSMKKKSSFGSHFKMPKFSAKGDVEKLHESDDSSDSEDENSKKGLKLGFKMPKLSASGKSDINFDSDANVNVKLPEYELPSVEAEASLPEADLSMKKKSSFGSHFKMPTFSTKANVGASGSEKIHDNDDSSDSEDESSKKGTKFGFKMPKLSMGGKHDVDLDSDATLKVKLPEQELPSVDAELALPDADLATKKASFGSNFKMPTFSAKANVGATGAEQVEASDNSSDSEDEKSKKGFKLGFKMPDFSMGGKADVNLDSESTIKANQPELNLPNLEVDLSLPEADLATKKKSSFGSHFKMPSFSPKANVRVASDAKIRADDDSSDSEDEDSKRGLKVGFKMPKLSMSGKDGVLLDAETTKVKKPELNLPSAEVDMSLPEADLTTKKKASFGSHFKMPTFSTKANVNAVGAGPVSRSEDSSDSEDEKSEKNLKLGFKMPDLSVRGKGDLNIDSDANIKIKHPEKQLPSIDAELDLPEVELATKKKSSFGSHFKMPTFSAKTNVGLSGTEQANTSDDSSDSEDDNSKNGLKLGFKGPKLTTSAKSDIKVDSDATFNVKLPESELPTFEVEASPLDADLSMKKKSSFGSHFKMPTFSTKGKSGDAEKVHASDDSSDSEDEASKKGVKLGFKMPKLSAGGKGDINLDPHANVNVKLPEYELPSTEAEASLPEADLSMKKKSSFGSHFKMPTFSTKANVSASGAEKIHDSDDSSDSENESSKKGMKLGFKMPKLSMGGKHDVDLDSDATLNVKVPEQELPSLDGELSLPDADLATKKKSSFGSHFKMPTFSAKAKSGASGADQATSDDSSDTEDENSKKGRKLDFKMPDFSVSGKNDVYVDPELEIKAKQPELHLPTLQVSLSPPEAELITTKKKSSFGSHFKMPTFSAKTNVGTGGAEPADASDDSSDSESEKSKKGFKFGTKMPDLSMGGKGDISLDSDIAIKQHEAQLPALDAEISLPEADLSVKKKGSFGSHFKMPSFSTKANVGASVAEVPDIDIVTPRVQIEEEHGVAGTDDSEKKSHKIGMKLPKFQTRQRSAEVSLPQVELKTEDSSSEDDSDKELKVKVKKPKFGIKLPEFNKPKLDAGVNVPSQNGPSVDLTQSVAVGGDVSNVDIQVGNIDAEVAKVKAQLAQLQAEFDIQSGKQQMKTKEDDSSSSSSDSETDKDSKPSGIHFGLKLPKFSIGKEIKAEAEPKLEATLPSVSLKTKTTGDEMTSPSLSSLEVEPVKLESGSGHEKEKKKFSLGLKMPKFPSKTGAVAVESEVASSSKDMDAVPVSKAVKINVKAPKMKLKKKKGDHHRSSSSDTDGDEENNDEEDQPRNKDATGNTQLMGVEVKLPRVQMYKNVEYQDAEKTHHESSSDEEDEVKDIKKNIGARFGVKLKKPKMFSSNKIEITSKNDAGNNSNTLQPEWKLPRVDLRRASKSSDQELSIEVDLDGISEQQKLEQLSPSERAEAIRRDSKSSAGIRLHSPSYISLMPSPRSKKPTLETLDVDSSPKLLSVTRLDPTPPIESSGRMQQPLYGNMELTTTLSGPQVSASQVPSSVIMASDAVKMKRGPPTPARRFIVPFEPNSTVLHVSQPVITSDVTVEGGFSTMISNTLPSEVEVIRACEPSFISDHNQQASDTDISITTSTGSDTLVISCPAQSSGQQEAHNRKASSLGDLTRIPTSGSEEGSLERTVSLDFKPVSTLAGSSSRAIYNLAVQDLSRVGEDSDEDYNLNRKRTISEHGSVDSEVTVVTADEADTPRLMSTAGMTGGNRTYLNINTDNDCDNVTLRPLSGDMAESLWFGSTSIQTVESVQTTMSYNQMDESLSTDVTLTTSLGTSPSEGSSSSEDSPFSPASPEPSGESTPNLIEHSSQVGNGRTPQFHTEITELAQGELGYSDSHTITLEMSSLSDDSQPQPLTDLNPSAGNFAAVRNRFEQLSGSNPLNGGENTDSLGRSSGRTSQNQGTVIKRLSGNFEDLPPSSVNVLQKPYMQHIAPELSEGALSRTVIISSLTLDRAEQNSVSTTTGIGPESPVPNLEPPC